MSGRAARAMLVAALFAGVAGAAQPSRITPDAAYRELARTGFLEGVTIDGDLDLARIRAVRGVKRIELKDVRLQGRLHASGAGLGVPLSIEKSTLRGIDLRGARVPAAFALEGSTVEGGAYFDDVDFAGPFVLHAVTFAGKASFRRVRFGAPVEVVFTEFREPAGASGGVSFAQARFAAAARFDHSRFASDVRFDTARFDGDATFIRVEVPGRASFRNVLFGADAEFRFCSLGDADFGDADQMSVFSRLGDFRGCTMRSARFDFVDWRGDAMLVNVRIAPGGLSMRDAALRGARTDFTGLQVAGPLDLQRTQISALSFRWSDIGAAIQRAAPGSDVLRPLYRQLQQLKQDDEARDVWALLADQTLRERLGQPQTSTLERVPLRFEQAVWGWATGYGTQLGRIAWLMLLAWAVLSLPLAFAPRLKLGRWTGALAEAPARHHAAAPDRLMPLDGGRALAGFAYGFGLMFALPGVRLRPSAPLARPMGAYLGALRAIGALLLALGALTLANVSPVFQAILGKIVG